MASGEHYRQHFRGSYRWLDRAKGLIAPTITGSAFITGEGALILGERDLSVTASAETKQR